VLVRAWFFCINGCTEGKKVTQNLWQLNLSMKRDSDKGDLRIQVLSCISSPLFDDGFSSFWNFFSFMENFRPVVPLRCQQRRRRKNIEKNIWYLGLQSMLFNYTSRALSLGFKIRGFLTQSNPILVIDSS
jgi:hypothetical protein